MPEPNLPVPARIDSEVGRLRTVLLHRPGRELHRLTPRNSADLLFDAIPWAQRAREEHDAFAAVLRARGVDVRYVTDLLTDVLETDAGRATCVDAVTADPRLGQALRDRVASYLGELSPSQLCDVLVAGVARDELPDGTGLRWRLMGPHEFVVDPLPNLLFTRDSSVWLGDRVAVASPSMRARRREARLLDAIYRHHPAFAGTRFLHEPGPDLLEGGDVLALAPGVVAVGVGQRTTPAGAERLAATLFGHGLARVVLAVPISQRRATMHLDTVCTMVDADAVVIYPPLADTLEAYPMTPAGPMTPGARGAVAVGEPRLFLHAAAQAMGVERLRVVGTGLDPVTADREQWDDGNNTLALAPGVVVAYQRNTETNARLADAGIEVLTIAGSELGSGRGGPRCMSCPIYREPLP